MDSVVLSDIMLKIKREAPIQLSLFHMNYNMHSKSKKIEEYCKKISDILLDSISNMIHTIIHHQGET